MFIKTPSPKEQNYPAITQVIGLGKKQTYLTHMQIKDLLPEIVTSADLQAVVYLLENTCKIKVFEAPPSEEELALLKTSEEIPGDLEEIIAIANSM